MNGWRAAWRHGLAAAAIVAAVAAPGAPAAKETDKASAVDLVEVRERAESMPAAQRRDTDKRIALTVERVNKEATERGQTTMAARLGAEFGMDPEALLDLKAEHGLNWGEVMIAYTLLANSGTRVTMTDLATLRRDGFGWGAIAYGLQFHMEDFEDAIKAEGKVAMGLSKADGKAAAIGR